MSNFSRNIFTGIPVEYLISNKAKVVFVADYFIDDVQGGAELTSEAIIAKCPYKIAKIHSASLTKKMVDENKDKYWIFGNYVALNSFLIAYLPDAGINYSVIEYDFKYCAFRSEQRHLAQTGQPCSCVKDSHGLNVERFMQKASHIFWMSQGQKDVYLKALPSLTDSKHVIQSSTFDDKTLDLISELSTKNLNSDLKEKKVYSVLGGGSWIKGVEETAKWCQLNKKNYRPLPAMPYAQFLDEMSKSYGLVFMPLDFDTCPRVVIEAKLLGLETILNNNVLMKDDPWFTGPKEETEAYLRTRTANFWDTLNEHIW